MVDWRYFQRVTHSRFHKLLNGKQPEASTTPAFLLTFSFCNHPTLAANRPFTWKLLLGMQTVAAPPGGQTDRNINMLHDWTYWRRTRILTAVLLIVQHCAQQYSQRSLVQHTVSVSWTLSHFKLKTDVWRLFFFLWLHRPRPNRWWGGASASSPTSSGSVSTSAVLLLKINTEILVQLSSQTD